MDELFFCFLENEHLGRDVIVVSGDETYEGVARELTHDCIRIVLDSKDEVEIKMASLISIKNVTKITRPPTGSHQRLSECKRGEQ